MCGLLGVLTSQKTAGGVAPTLAPALKCMRHRGPDDAGVWHDEDLVLGFNRLSIIDIEHAHQPLRWGPPEQPDRYVLTFNGEIYNYLELRAELEREHGVVFATKGDGEPIIAGFHHWGLEVLNRLRGMFAIGIWDTHTRELLLARDPFGIKPLFYVTGPGGTVFSSERKSVSALAEQVGASPAIDRRALQHYVALQYVPEPETLLAPIARLESGCYARLGPGDKVIAQRYFTPRFAPERKLELGEAVSTITAALEDSVEKHMRADVTVGSFLSGGIDSTAIAALARRHNPGLLTFTASFAREGYSEADVAAETAAALGVAHHIREVSPEEYAAAVPSILWYLDEPVADPSLIPLYFVAQEARKHVKVVLSGEGADELFGGYTIYKEPVSLKPFDYVPSPLKAALRAVGRQLPAGMRGKSLIERGTIPLETRYYGNARSFNDDQLRQVLPWARADWGHTDVTAPIYAQSRGWDPVARMQHIDALTWLRGDILVKADKMTMANSLELRVPFLDRVVYDAARNLTVDQKLSQGTTKYALRRALETIVPGHVLHRKKLGFPVPLRHWLAGEELHDWAREQILAAQTDAYIDKQAVLALLEEHTATGPTDHSRRLWTIICFMIWHGITVEGRIKPDIPELDYPVRL